MRLCLSVCLAGKNTTTTLRLRTQEEFSPFLFPSALMSSPCLPCVLHLQLRSAAAFLTPSYMHKRIRVTSFLGAAVFYPRPMQSAATSASGRIKSAPPQTRRSPLQGKKVTPQIGRPLEQEMSLFCVANLLAVAAVAVTSRARLIERPLHAHLGS